MLHGFLGLDRPSVHRAIWFLAHLCDTLPYACAGVLCIAFALARRRAWRALAVACLLAVTGITTQLLKHALAQPRLEHWLPEQVATNSWPSGHSTAAMTLALCAILVAPPALRASAAMLGGAFAVGVGYAVLVLGWHYPSDVLGGFLVAGLWTSLAVAVLHRVEAPEPARRPAWEPLAGLAVGAGVVAAVVLGVRADTVALYTSERPTFAVGRPRRGGGGRARGVRGGARRPGGALPLRPAALRRRRAPHRAPRPHLGDARRRGAAGGRPPTPMRTARVARSSARR